MSRGEIEKKVFVVKNKETGLNHVYIARTISAVRGASLKSFINEKRDEIKARADATLEFYKPLDLKLAESINLEGYKDAVDLTEAEPEEGSATPALEEPNELN